MKQVVVVFFMVILVSCSPQRRLARLLTRYPIPADTVVQTHTVYEPDSIPVYIPGDTVVNEVLIETTVDLPDTTISAETDYARAEAGLLDNILWLELIQTDTVVEIVVDSVKVTEYVDRIVTKTVVGSAPSDFWKHGFLVLMGLLIVAVILRYLLKR